MAHVKLRTLGRGAYGTAVLYRREDDNALVVIKQFDLSATADRTRALVRVRQSRQQDPHQSTKKRKKEKKRKGEGGDYDEREMKSKRDA